MGGFVDESDQEIFQNKQKSIWFPASIIM